MSLSSLGEFEPRSLKGQPSIEVFGLNRRILTQGRGDAWHFLLIALPAYDVFCRTGDLEMQERTRRLVQRASFASVFAFMLEIADGPDATVLINNQDSLQAIHDHPEIRTWV